MHCPTCKMPSLTQTSLENHLHAQQCKTCAGHWISAQNYWQWIEHQGETLPEKAPEDLSLEIVDHQKIIFCLDCHHLMLKYRVGHGTNFYLDRCSKCGGVWFDRNEWEALKQRNLHDEIHLIFSNVWQHKIRRSDLKHVADNAYRSILGDEDYPKAVQIKDWLTKHPKAEAILSFLNQAIR
ncbi:MAG: zf-TFIIB domain-containing protein [Cyanobacteria bacterium J06635_15]